MCIGLMNPDADLGKDARHGEVFDDQAASYILPGVQTAGACLLLDQGHSNMEASHAVGVG